MQNQTPTEPTGLQAIIPPEVYLDAFSAAIRNVASSAPIDTVLEIGSSSGEGSTLAWVEGLRLNPRKPKLYCMEVSKVRCEALEKRWGPSGIVECFLGSSVDLDQFPTEEQVTKFYNEVDGPLRNYPLEQVLGWMRDDIDYIKKEGVKTGNIRDIKRARGIKNFGAVLIDGSEFTGDAELDEVYGADYILLDDTQTYKCYQAHQRLLRDPAYDLLEEDPKLRHGYSVFRKKHRTLLDPLPADAPVHYFTIVLNGEPFIRHHIEVLKDLPFPWHWHIIEGAATLTHDTAWSTAAGGTLPDERHRDGLSNDGTTAYLDELAARYPQNISLYRPPAGRLWDGKIEMVSAPLGRIFDDGILWEIDADELWTRSQLITGRDMFLKSPEKTAAWFWCHYFVGEHLAIASRDCYAQNPRQEWLRAWRFQPGMRWQTHEPPVLARRLVDGTWKNVAEGSAFTHRETEALGLVFQHFAYATEAQVAFKERYYGYAGAVESWRRLQATMTFPTLLRESLSWVPDHTEVNTDAALGIIPLARRNPATSEWTFLTEAPPPPSAVKHAPTIVVDAVFFQFSNTGIARVWLETFHQWVQSGVAEHVWVLDRDGTAPVIEGIRRHRIARFEPTQAARDAAALQNACDLLKADVFISTYYTFPLSTPSVGMIYDMIPELMNLRGTDWQWIQKEYYILNTSRFACISQSTANDLRRFHPEIPESEVTVTFLAASPGYGTATPAQIQDFKARHGLDKDYILLTGERIGLHVGTQGYKNAALAFRGWSLLPAEQRQQISIVCAGGKAELEAELHWIAPDADVRIIRFSDADLALAYAGAITLIYPSLYEGFGLPVIEAMACGCPVITSRRASLPEVAGEAGIYVDPWSPEEVADAILRLHTDAAHRQDVVARGLTQAARFTFKAMAAKLAAFLNDTAGRGTSIPEARLHLPRPQTIIQPVAPPQAAAAAGNNTELIAQVEQLRVELASHRDSLKKAKDRNKKEEKRRKGEEKRRKKAEALANEERFKRRHPIKAFFRKLRGKSSASKPADQSKDKPAS